jgi:O-acetyl-ADP-ribose deacetylase (regulator of RNase III)
VFQNALAQLQRNEAYAVMADTGARLCALTQSSTGIAECPPARYFQDAAAEIQNCSKDTHLSIEEAMVLLERFEKHASKKADVNTDDALTGRLLIFFTMV